MGYGQGMSVAARQAKLLRDILCTATTDGDPIAAIQTRFMSEVDPLLQTPWSMGVNADFAYPCTRGKRPEGYEEGRLFEAALFRATVADPVVHSAFSDVVQLVKPFDYLQSPDIRQRIEAQAQGASPRAASPFVGQPDGVSGTIEQVGASLHPEPLDRASHADDQFGVA
jgi:hypothetical protein